MMPFLPHILLVFIALLTNITSALRIAQGSPCSSACANTHSDSADPQANTTSDDDIVCEDQSYASTSAGRKFQGCLECLQESTYVSGEETDQQWFLYNLAYAVDYCLLGSSDASSIGSDPCRTATACGALKGMLLEGDSSSDGASPYSYCETKVGTTLTSSSFSGCLSCVRSDQGSGFLANFVVALEAGCQEKPPPGKALSLNDTIFAETVVHRLEVTPSPASLSEDSEKKANLPLTTIVAIAVSAGVVLLLAVACIFLLRRRKRARSEANGSGEVGSNNSDGNSPKSSNHVSEKKVHFRKTFGNAGRGLRRTTSSLDFKCRTRVTPIASRFDFRDLGVDEEDEEGHDVPVPSGVKVPEEKDWERQRRMYLVHPGDALGSNPVLATVPSSPADPPNNTHASPVRGGSNTWLRDNTPPHPPPAAPLPAPPQAAAFYRSVYTPPPRINNRPGMASLNLVTPRTPSPPPALTSSHSSPLQRLSPRTPSSATPSSAHSAAPLLHYQPYILPDYGVVNPKKQRTSPRLGRAQDKGEAKGLSIREQYQRGQEHAEQRYPWEAPLGEPAVVPESEVDAAYQWDVPEPRPAQTRRPYHARKEPRLMGTPTETRILPMTFAGPPGR